MTPLDKLKLKLGCKDDSSRDELLELLLDDAKADILAYTRRNESQWLPEFERQRQAIAELSFGRLGLEGVSSRSEGGVSTAFFGVDDWPKSVTDTLNPRRLIGVV